LPDYEIGTLKGSTGWEGRNSAKILICLKEQKIERKKEKKTN